MRRLFVCLSFAACATTQSSPSEKLVFDYTQAFLRRDLEHMSSVALAGVKHPTPSVYYSSRKVVRTCPPQPAKGGPEAQSMLVLVGNVQNQYFEAFQVTVGHYGSQWLVMGAERVNTPSGTPLMYSRSCQPVYGTYGGGTSY